MKLRICFFIYLVDEALIKEEQIETELDMLKQKNKDESARLEKLLQENDKLNEMCLNLSKKEKEEKDRSKG